MLHAFHEAVADTVMRVDLPLAQQGPDVPKYVLGQLDALPAHVATGVDAAALLLSGTSAVRGHRFEHLGADARARAVARWDASRLPPVQLYMRLIRSLVLFGAYEDGAS